MINSIMETLIISMTGPPMTIQFYMIQNSNGTIPDAGTMAAMLFTLYMINI